MLPLVQTGYKKYLIFIDDRSILKTMDSKIKKRPGRPPKSGLSAKDTREKLLKVGVEILTLKGFFAIGLEEILSSAGVPKGSFYHYFKSKEDFGLQVIDAYDLYFQKRLQQTLGQKNLSPLSRIEAFVEKGKEGMERHGFTRGCLAGNLGQEMGSLNQNYRNRIEKLFEDWQNAFADCFSDAIQAKELSNQADPSALAWFFVTGWEGAVLRAKLCQSSEPLDFFLKQCLQFWPKP